MSGNVVVVLHAPADVALAGEIARELSPFGAFTLCVSVGRPTRVGAGAIGVVVWTASFAALDLGEPSEDAIICLADRTTPPLEGRPLRTVVGGAYGEMLRAEVSAVQAARAEARNGAALGGGGLAATAAAYAAQGAGNRMVVRSTAGLAAALAVVGVATPFVGGGQASESDGAQNVTLSLVGEAMAATGRVRPVSMQAPATRRESMPAAVLPLQEGDRNAEVLAMLDALDSAPSRAAVSPVQPTLSRDRAHVEVLSNGELGGVTEIAALDLSDAADLVDPALQTVDPALFVIDASFSESSAESLIHEAKLSSYHRKIGPPD
jgi:hypothetical protein